MDDLELKIRRRLRNEFVYYAKHCLKVRSKSGEIKPFYLNQPQVFINDRVEQQRRETGKIRAIILKGRQQGCSTYIEGRFYWRVTHSFGLRAFILTHDNDATNNLFEMAQRYHEHCPAHVRTRIEASNSKELIFSGLDSGYKLGTAGNKAVGRSSTIQLLHGSEVAYWPHAADHAKGVLQAVPNDSGTEIFIESTANGLGNYFHEQWQLAEAGQSDFINIFVPWYWQDEYQKELSEPLKLDEYEHELIELYDVNHEQLNWRRYKIIELSVGGMDGTKAFMQEYPCNTVEAFQKTGEDSFIPPEIVFRARKCSVDPYGSLILGVDPARYGDDRSSIIRRRGRVAYKLQSYKKKDTMELTGLVHMIIKEERPDKVCIDIVGIGAGVYDRLVELGYKDILVPVTGGETPLNDKRFRNKRAEQWGEMKEWLFNGNVSIDDSDSLHADLCCPRWTSDSNGRILIESKDSIKKRGLRSPDEADALALTFAVPNIAVLAHQDNKYNDIAKSMSSAANNVDRLKRKAYAV